MVHCFREANKAADAIAAPKFNSDNLARTIPLIQSSGLPEQLLRSFRLDCLSNPCLRSFLDFFRVIRCDDLGLLSF